MRKNKLNIFDFMDYRQYLMSLFKMRQESNSAYSMRKFSKDLGFSSPGYAKYILVDCKPLGAKGIESISNHLKLKEQQKNYFKLLVKLGNEQCEQKRSEIEHQLIELLPVNSAILLEDEYYYYLSNRMCTVICMLIEVNKKDFVADPYWISRKTRLPTSLSEINKALDFLIKHKFIEKTPEGYVNRTLNLKSNDEIRSVAVQNFHRTVLAEGVHAISEPVGQREFQHLTVTIPAEKVSDLKNRLKEFLQKTKEWINSQEGEEFPDSRTAISLNIQMYQILSGDD